MRYNQSDFDYVLESMENVDLSTQVNRLVESGDEDFASAVCEAFEDIYTALESGNTEDIEYGYAILEEYADTAEEDPNIIRKAKRKALMKKVASAAAVGSAYGAATNVVINKINDQPLNQDRARAIAVNAAAAVLGVTVGRDLRDKYYIKKQLRAAEKEQQELHNNDNRYTRN